MLCALALLLVSAEASANELEWTANLSLGGGAVVPESRGVFRLGLRTELTFLRANNREVGLGVSFETVTSTFTDVMAATGIHILLPVHHAAPLILSVGPHYRFSGEHSGGIGGRLWWGVHNHNHFHPYNSSFGIWVEVRADLLGDDEILVAGGVDIDLSIFAYPFMWIERWARGPERL